ncbi:gliding motility protein GldG [Olavius algarvensis associated proteobacterium Delta 3]|nr:gliding motility protein GldG [Olavius algarvensis associated proteobacterium Delta 3]CAB5126016.1 gliding motility protein GldG [Olavius algarvensis associated proteobacterium Delta 3]
MSDQNKNVTKSLFSVGGMLLLLVIVVLVNLLASRVNLRWDLTHDNIYSLSDGTKKILSEMERDVTIKLFYPRSNAGIPVSIKNYGNRLIDFLEEYELYSKGKLRVEIFDPEPDSEEEEWAQKYGIDGIKLPSGDQIYFGLVAVAADQEETIRMLDPSAEQRLEYDITRIVARVQSPDKITIGVISGLPVFGGARTNFQPSGQGQPWLFIQELKKTYNVTEISPVSKTAVSDDAIDLLLVIHPRDMSEEMTYYLDQYILGGRNALILVDPSAVMDMNPGMLKSSGLPKLFKQFGIRMDTTKVLVDFGLATRLRDQNGQIEENPLWVSLKPESFNADSVITAKLEGMLLPVVGMIEKIPDHSVTYEALLRSSNYSGLTDAFKTQFGASELRRDFTATAEIYDLAVILRGSFKTAFPEGNPVPAGTGKTDTDTGADRELSPHLSESRQPSTLLIMADTDFLFDGYYVNRQNFLGFEIANIFNDNLNFLLNSIELMTGSEDLIDIRSRGTHERPFEKVQELEEKAQARWLAREQELVRKVEETNLKLRQLEQQKDASQNLILSEEQEAEIQRFQEEKIRINRQLKDVRRNLRADIERLGNRIKFINLFAVAILVSLGGVFYGLYRRRKGFSE